jgi:hypothetical protein
MKSDISVVGELLINSWYVGAVVASTVKRARNIESKLFAQAAVINITPYCNAHNLILIADRLQYSALLLEAYFISKITQRPLPIHIAGHNI